MPKKKYPYTTLIINFKSQHKDLYDWLKDYCDKNGLSISQVVRDLIKKMKEGEARGNHGNAHADSQFQAEKGLEVTGEVTHRDSLGCLRLRSTQALRAELVKRTPWCSS